MFIKKKMSPIMDLLFQPIIEIYKTIEFLITKRSKRTKSHDLQLNLKPNEASHSQLHLKPNEASHSPIGNYPPSHSTYKNDPSYSYL